MEKQVVTMSKGVHIIANVAQSLNGVISGDSPRRVIISNREDLERVHRLRAQSDAIIVGANTVKSDNPDLKVNRTYFNSSSQPVRIILDGKLTIPDDSKVLDGSSKTLVFTANRERKIKGAETILSEYDRIPIDFIVEELAKRSIKNVLIEGGAYTINTFLQEGVVDEFYLFIGNVILPENGIHLFRSTEQIRNVILNRSILGDGLLLSLDARKIGEEK